MMINFFLLEIWSLNSESLQYQLVASRIEKRFPEGMVRNTLFYSNFKHKLHCAKSVRIRSFSGPYFAAFRLNKERYQVSLRIQSECGKIRTRKTPNTDPFYTVLNITYIFEELLLAAFVILSLTCETQSQIKNTG